MENKNAFEKIHKHALEVVQRYHRSEIELLEALDRVDTNRVYTRMGYSSLFQYAVKALQLSEEVAYVFINVARKSREVPALKTKIKDGSITVSKARKITSVLNKQNQDHWLELAQNVSKKKIEREVAKVSPKQAVREKASYVHPLDEIKDKVSYLKSHESRLQLQVGVSEKLMIKLRRVQDLLSQKQGTAASLEDALDAMTDLYIEKKDTVKKAIRQKARGKLQNLTVPGHSSSVGSGAKVKGNHYNQQVLGLVKKGEKTKRTPLTAKIKNQIFLQYNGRCAAIDQNQKRCQQRRWLDIHHKLKVSDGGNNELSNLILLCKGHHNTHHIH